MAKELEKRGEIVGSRGYFAQLHSRGLLRRIMRQQDSIDYERALREIAHRANNAARTVLDDASAAGPMLRFVESRDLERIAKAIEQLEKLCHVARESLSCARECLDYLTLNHRDTELLSRTDVRDLERAYDILRGSGSYDLPDSRERILRCFCMETFSTRAMPPGRSHGLSPT